MEMIDNINSNNREENCRMGKGGNSALVNIENPEAKRIYSKQSFLKNRYNKMQLINLLKSTFVEAFINVRQSHRDQDVMICKTTLTMSAEGKSVQVSEKNTDLLVIVIHYWEKNMKLFFRTPFKLD